jgi:mannose-1-phosphate guanylyltransferase
MASADLTALVLAAGRGERMLPLSRVMPKPALPVVDRPLVAWGLRQASAAGARSITVNTWHRARAMERAVAEVELGGIRVDISAESELMGTAGGLALARDRGLVAGSGPVLVLNGDCLFDLALEPVMERHRRARDLVTLALLPHPDPSRWARIHVDERGLVVRILPPGGPGEGEIPLLFPGVMMVSREALDRLPPGPGETPDALWRPAREAGRLGAVVVSGRWREVGTPSAYLETVLDLLAGSTRIEAGAEIHPSASISQAVVGRRALVEEGAVVTESVVAEGARVRRGARVVRSVLLGDVEAAEGEVVIDQMRAARSMMNAE